LHLPAQDYWNAKKQLLDKFETRAARRTLIFVIFGVSAPTHSVVVCNSALFALIALSALSLAITINKRAYVHKKEDAISYKHAGWVRPIARRADGSAPFICTISWEKAPVDAQEWRVRGFAPR
jgi:hypothetical protein